MSFLLDSVLSISNTAYFRKPRAAYRLFINRIMLMLEHPSVLYRESLVYLLRTNGQVDYESPPLPRASTIEVIN